MNTRRLFIKDGVVALVATAAGASTAQATPGAARPPRWGMVVDLNRCNGCEACVVACKAQNRTAPGEFNTRILKQEERGAAAGRMLFTPVQCNHCEDPPCVQACAADALRRLADGIVVNDWDRCISLGRCRRACPYDVPFLDPRHGLKADKCDFCIDRVAQGLLPACVEACGPKARLFGDFDAPQGELAEYLRRGGLAPRPPAKGRKPQKTRVLYVAKRPAPEVAQ